eukprot:CAMPEP_0182483464 /NCGR_PEP_ID=MMETSP1319-20130603/41368_1 /TAXON_ID=172717 /ORGANISM="Bolidomonas pacifica, Strain RCC208" /LENGTH=473 /DNA_ID=CAMNT_0024685271 /DNA_START=86 /DNA_END=1503 /DNA_ORIENTATION=-
MGLLSSPVFDKKESRGYIACMVVRGAGFSSSLFVQFSLISLAYRSMRCTSTGKQLLGNQTVAEAEDAGIDCQGEFPGTGMPVISGFALLSSISSVLTFLSFPLLGAFADTTPQRKTFTIGTLLLYVVYSFPLIFIDEGNWPVYVFVSLFGMQILRDFHNPCIAAYCTEIAEGEEQLVALQSVGRFYELVSGLVMLGAVGLVGGGGMGLDIKGIAVIGNIAFLGLGLPTLAFVSTRLQERPVLRQRRGSILDPLFQFFSTVKELWRTNTALLQYLCGVACTDCSISGLVFLLPIYAMQQLNIANPAYLVGLVMLFCPLGAIIGKNLGSRTGARHCYVAFLALLVVSQVVGVAFVTKPEHVLRIYPLSVGFGVALGGIMPMQKSVYMSVIPSGQEVEMQGIYLLFSQVLSFFPNLWFGYCVSAEVGGESNSRRAGVGALVAFSIAGMCLCGLFFDDERGKVKAQETAKLRFRGKG